MVNDKKIVSIEDDYEVDLRLERAYVKYAKQLFQEIVSIFGNLHVGQAVLERDSKEDPAEWLAKFDFSAIHNNIIYDLYDSLLLPPKAFYNRYLAYNARKDGSEKIDIYYSPEDGVGNEVWLDNLFYQLKQNVKLNALDVGVNSLARAKSLTRPENTDSGSMQTLTKEMFRMMDYIDKDNAGD